MNKKTNIALKVRKTVCKCGKEREEVVMGKETSKELKILTVVGFHCRHCGHKKIIDEKYVMDIKRNYVS